MEQSRLRWRPELWQNYLFIQRGFLILVSEYFVNDHRDLDTGNILYYTTAFTALIGWFR